MQSAGAGLENPTCMLWHPSPLVMACASNPAAGGWLFDPLKLSGDAERYERMRVGAPRVARWQGGSC